jgi:2-polyprenyl-6-methoxyphenol hydroxylase-like FAD-dependent oxidoreductase
MKQVQVMIVGAGPVGMTLAAELERYGVKVRIVDKAAQRTDKSKALVLWSRTLELMDRGIGTSRFLAAGFNVNVLNLISGHSTIGRVDMGSVNSPYPFALMIPQSETERLLEERLVELGVSVERSVEVTSISKNAEGATASLTHPDGRQEVISADWLVGCDGAHSIVRHSLGASFDGETNESDWILADVHMSGYATPDTEASVYWSADGAFVIFPISPGRYRVLADLPASGETKPPIPDLAKVQAIIDRRGPGNLKAFDPIWLAGFRINGRKVSEYRWGRVVLAGDAAHVHSPAGGQGMNTGMQDAFNLAWKLAMVVHGTMGETLLESYSPERSHVGDQVLKSAGALTAVGTLRNPIARGIRDMIGHLMFGVGAVQRAFANNMTEMAVEYPKSPLNGPNLGGATLQAGERVAPITGQLPVGEGSIPKFVLFGEASLSIKSVLARYSQIIEPIVRPSLGAQCLSLVRPDGYVAGNFKNPEELSAYLGRISEHKY